MWIDTPVPKGSKIEVKTAHFHGFKVDVHEDYQVIGFVDNSNSGNDWHKVITMTCIGETQWIINRQAPAPDILINKELSAHCISEAFRMCARISNAQKKHGFKFDALAKTEKQN